MSQNKEQLRTPSHLHYKVSQHLHMEFKIRIIALVMYDSYSIWQFLADGQMTRWTVSISWTATAATPSAGHGFFTAITEANPKMHQRYESSSSLRTCIILMLTSDIWTFCSRPGSNCFHFLFHPKFWLSSSVTKLNWLVLAWTCILWRMKSQNASSVFFLWIVFCFFGHIFLLLRALLHSV